MKKVTLYIGIFIVFFLVVGAYMAQAQVTELNGTWLKFTGSLKGMEFTGGPGSEEVGGNDNEPIRLYGCVVDSPYFFDDQFFVQLYEKNRTVKRAGAAVFQKSAGTANQFAGWFNMNLMDEYIPATPDLYSTSISAPGKVTIKGDKIDFKGFGGQVEKVGGGYAGYSVYGVKKLNAKTVTARSLP